MKATLTTDTRHLSLVGQAETELQQLPQADNLEVLQRRINRRVLHDLFKAHPQLQVSRTSSQAFSILVVTAADDKPEIDATELIRQLQ